MKKLKTMLGSRRVAALACALVSAGALATAGAAGASASPLVSPAVAAPSIGVEWFATPNAETQQCGTGPASNWGTAPNWTPPILIDTDGRGGGCLLAFGIFDPANALGGLSITYNWSVSPSGASGQCEDPNAHNAQGTYTMPIRPFQTFGTTVLDDTDNRLGYCNLTFTVSGRSDIGLDVQFSPTTQDAGAQCVGAQPPGIFQTASEGSPVTIGLDTDNRAGGCTLSLRLEHIGF